MASQTMRALEAPASQPPAPTLDAPPPEAPARAGSPGRRDLFAMAALVVLSLLVGEAPNVVRIPIGLLAVLLVPGYALTAVLFPSDEHVDGIERLALALGVSIALVGVEAYALDWASGGLSPDNIRTCVAATSGALLMLAFIKRSQVERPAGPPARPVDAPRRRPRSVRFTQAIVVANVAVATLAYGLTLGDKAPEPTQFYVVNRDGLMAGYPREVAVGEPTPVRLGILQSTASSGSYRVVVRRGEQVLSSLGPISVSGGATWEATVDLVCEAEGPDQEFTFALEQAGESRPYRLLRLWVSARGQGAP
jgi:uncharacterized membrane protein